MAGLPQNQSQLSLAALKWLKDARWDAPPHNLHLLSLAWQGLEDGAEGEWLRENRHALEGQVAQMFGWEPKNALAFLLSNPEDENDQEQELLQALQRAQSPKQAAAMVLNQLYSRMQSELPALQPAASELS